MDILKLNTTPSFEIVPRIKIQTTDTLSIVLTNEATGEIQTISISLIQLLPNENYKITLLSFPTGNAFDKFSYKILRTLEVISLGKLIITDQNKNTQDYTKQNFYY